MLTVRHKCTTEEEHAIPSVPTTLRNLKPSKYREEAQRDICSSRTTVPEVKSDAHANTKIQHTQPGAYLICKPYPRLFQSQSEERRQHIYSINVPAQPKLKTESWKIKNKHNAFSYHELSMAVLERSSWISIIVLLTVHHTALYCLLDLWDTTRTQVMIWICSRPF